MSFFDRPDISNKLLRITPWDVSLKQGLSYNVPERSGRERGAAPLNKLLFPSGRVGDGALGLYHHSQEAVTIFCIISLAIHL